MSTIVSYRNDSRIWVHLCVQTFSDNRSSGSTCWSWKCLQYLHRTSGNPGAQWWRLRRWRWEHSTVSWLFYRQSSSSSCWITTTETFDSITESDEETCTSAVRKVVRQVLSTSHCKLKSETESIQKKFSTLSRCKFFSVSKPQIMWTFWDFCWWRLAYFHYQAVEPVLKFGLFHTIRCYCWGNKRIFAVLTVQGYKFTFK